MTPSIPNPVPPGDGVRTAVLSPWDQVAMRSYMRTALCFPLDDAARPAAARHLRAALSRLARQRPDFAGRVRTGPAGAKQGYVFLETGPDDEIPFEAHDISADFGYTFPQLRDADFPPGAFVQPYLGVPCDMRKPVSVAVVRAFFIAGGLVLAIFFHHSFADGDCLRLFVESIAAQTRGDPVGPAAARPPPPKGSDGVFDAAGFSAAAPRDVSADDVRRLAPEYALLETPCGPTVPRPRPGGVPAEQIKKTGKTFVFDNRALAALRAAVQEQTGAVRPPSNYVALATLAWAHVTRARLRDVEYVPKGGLDTPARLQTMVNWKARASAARSAGYFGNATIVAVTQLSTRRVVDGCGSPRALGALAAAVEATIAGVDDGFVERRTRLFEALPDPRRLGLDFDPRTPQDLGFNTWRYFGADTRWRLAGDEGEEAPAAAMRRVQEAWNMSGALILPARRGSAVHELLVTLPATAMELLCKDGAWMRWVARTVG